MSIIINEYNTWEKSQMSKQVRWDLRRNYEQERGGWARSSVRKSEGEEEWDEEEQMIEYLAITRQGSQQVKKPRMPNKLSEEMDSSSLIRPWERGRIWGTKKKEWERDKRRVWEIRRKDEEEECVRDKKKGRRRSERESRRDEGTKGGKEKRWKGCALISPNKRLEERWYIFIYK